MLVFTRSLTHKYLPGQKGPQFIHFLLDPILALVILFRELDGGFVSRFYILRPTITLNLFAVSCTDFWIRLKRFTCGPLWLLIRKTASVVSAIVLAGSLWQLVEVLYSSTRHCFAEETTRLIGLNILIHHPQLSILCFQVYPRWFDVKFE